MKEKIKEFSKKYLIGFFIGLILFTVVGVSAATYFPSNQTTYNNGITGMKATNVQTAIDELYNTCFPPTLGDQILENTELEKDPYECRYFFKGANPNNYINFNNEIWRIISVECDGTIKIMRNESIGNMVWDSSDSNSWERPSTLNTYLNGTYYNGLNTTSKSQIVAKDWSVSLVRPNNNNLAEQINNENSRKWNGKVALITVSEYIRSNNNQSNCGTLSLNDDNYSICKNTNWMLNSTTWWTLSTYTLVPVGLYFVDSSGVLDPSSASNKFAVRPVVYLSSEVKITGGDGSQSNPYQLS